MAKYKAYPEYKDSGVEWLGEVPNHWKTVSISRLFSRIKRTGYTEKELLSVYRDYGVIPKSSRDDNNNKPSEDLSPYQLVEPNDLVMNKMKAWQGSIAISEYEGIVSPAYFVYKPNNILFELAHPRYVHYLLRNPIYVTQYLSRSKGIRVNQWDLDPDEFRNIELLLPDKTEQEKIYSFLDHETAKIDNLIEKQQQLIELLKEKRQAVISHAVTKGLNPDVPMKDSGVKWLGEVPAHWDSVRVKQVSSFITSGPRGWSDYITDDGDEIFLQSGDLNNELGLHLDKAKRVSPPKNAEGIRTRLMNGDVVICITGANTGRVAIVSKLSQKTYINQHLSLIRPEIPKINSSFLGYCLASSNGHSYFEVAQYGLKEGLNLSNIAEAPLALPPLHEQDAIVKYLKCVQNNYDYLSCLSANQVGLLQERRAALISAAVTGKIDVRDWVAPDTQDVEEPQEATA
ncbi:restriction endonuclease subunit S [Enterobacter hormaechei]|uniref:restriction endonuclease subunit S n=1 Tax=Enterobacter hormaechei TaxID=158836 RepID=UPI0029744725|nr:restriction endonuclease subunit S [Enterobacter hormaechei subsp. steigerwaltii]HAV1909711.1 restriction endonuclease subunit S [Enterobacter hormaechei subsp. steigerwaltii]